MKTKLLSSLLGLALCAVPFMSQAQDVTENVIGDVADGGVYGNPTAENPSYPLEDVDVWLGRPAFNIGGLKQYSAGIPAGDLANMDGVAVIPFLLPAIPSGKELKEVSLSANLIAISAAWGDMNCDLYGIAARPTADILASDFFAGTYDTDATATAIQAQFIPNAGPAGTILTNAGGNANLKTFIQAQYDNGKAGEYVFFRINPDAANVTTYLRVDVSSADDATPANKPMLNIVFQDGASSGPTPDFTIPAPTEDGFVSDPSAITTNNPWLWNAAKLGSSAVDGSANLTSVIIPFQLPARPSGETVDLANLNVYVSFGRQWLNANADLYGLPYQKASANGGTGRAIFSTDHFAGAYPDATSSVTAIEDDYFAKNVELGQLDTARWEETTAEANLIAYLNAQYDAGAVAGDWVFLRLSVDNTEMTGSQYFGIDGGDSFNPAKLQIGFTGTLNVEKIKKSALSLYPNPVTDGRLSVSLKGFSNNAELNIYAITGQLVHSEKVEANSRNIFNTTLNLNSGLYVVKLQDGNISKTQKLIIK